MSIPLAYATSSGRLQACSSTTRIVSLRAVCERQERRAPRVSSSPTSATTRPCRRARAALLDHAVENACARMSRVLARHRQKLEDRRRRAPRTR
jgi:hypothetical protein